MQICKHTIKKKQKMPAIVKQILKYQKKKKTIKKTNRKKIATFNPAVSYIKKYISCSCTEKMPRGVFSRHVVKQSVKIVIGFAFNLWNFFFFFKFYFHQFQTN